jgi:hypothetical protein
MGGASMRKPTDPTRRTTARTYAALGSAGAVLAVSVLMLMTPASASVTGNVLYGKPFKN